MCGIAGVLSFDGRPVSLARLRAMTDALFHRGPDDEGHYLGDGVGLGMRRLSIIDLAGGHQPIASEDGAIQVVMNGEIYNYRELSAELAARGHRFASASDTEAIVHLYEEAGDACVERLRGMFAFALWDARRRRLLLARDRLGIKPLFYALRPDALFFASELKAILALGEAPVELDWAAVRHLFTFLTTPSDRSIVAGVAKLEPGHTLAATASGDARRRRYWRLEFEPDRSKSEGEWCEALRAALDESVRLHRVSDVPLGAFLSGGIDSSAVVGSLSAASDEPVRTFSIGFREAEFDELPYARLAATEYRTAHREEVVEPDVLDELETLAWYLDEPFGDSSAIPTYRVSKLAAEEVTVVLSGDGGDELFAGYDRYRVERRERANRFLPRPVRALLGAVGEALPDGATGREMLRHLALVGADRYLDAGTLFKDDQLRTLFRPEAWRAMADCDPRAPLKRSLESEDGHWLSALQRLDIESYLPLDILTKVDRASMACSIEARVPLLDHPLVELAARIPAELKLKRGRTKHIFRRALEGRVPRAILDRPKRGFAVPLGRWFRGRLGEVVRELLLSERSRARGVVRPEAVARLLARPDRALDLELWTLLSFELWCRAFLDQGARRGFVPERVEPARLERALA
jgi:asparagine synthase (glutamine-hydrolysing)